MVFIGDSSAGRPSVIEALETNRLIFIDGLEVALWRRPGVGVNERTDKSVEGDCHRSAGVDGDDLFYT